MKYRVFFSILLLLSTAVFFTEQCKSPEKPVASLPDMNAYVGSETCTGCHQKEHQDWTHSHHFKAMLPASDSSVLGNFNNAEFNADGIHSRFFKKDGKFIINTQGEDGKNHDYEVKYSFGFKPLQQYLVEFPGGKMQATRVSWDDKQKKWFNQYAGQKIPHGDWLSWTGNGQSWNTMCASCHSTNLQKNYDAEHDTYKTTFNEVNVSCESCHGPGKLHIEFIQGADYAKGGRVKGSYLSLTKASSQIQQVNVCGYCHARRADLTGSVLPGAVFMDDFLPELPSTRFFYADGQMRDEDYNYTSFLQSKMFHRNVECSSCHNPHSGELKLSGSLVCSQCHAPASHDVPAHTMHGVNTPGVNCIACHMPSKIYMGIDERHDHSFRIPRPDLSMKYGTPNTCNSCHQNKTPAWAAAAIEKNFGPIRKYHFSEDLIPGSRLDAASEPHLLKLLGDTSIPEIIRATSVYYLGQTNTGNRVSVLLNHLQDSSAMVRFQVLEALRDAEPAQWMEAALPALQDTVRAVRIAAAELYCTVPENSLPQSSLNAFYAAKGELEKYINYQTDFAQGNVSAGDFYRRLNNLVAAEKFYRKAIVMDDKLTIARVNLASTLNSTGKNEEALQQLQMALKEEPKSDHIYYNLGLLLIEMNQTEKGIVAFKKAIALGTNNTRVYYNYGLLMQKLQKNGEAEKIFRAGLQKDPTNGDLLYALCVFYLQQQNLSSGMEVAGELKKYHGSDPNYQQLFQQLRIGAN